MSEYTEQKKKIIEILKEIPEEDRDSVLLNAKQDLYTEEYWAFVDKTATQVKKDPKWEEKIKMIDIYRIGLYPELCG